MDNIVYFDNAATTYPKPKCVYDSMDTFNRLNVGSYNRSSLSGEDIINETRTLLLDLFSCNENYEVSLQSSATEAMNTLLRGVEWDSIQNVYITHFEHNATVRTLYDLAKSNEFSLNYIEMSQYEYDLDKIKQQFKSISPDLIVMTQASNSFGLITPVFEIAELADQAISIVDAAQTAGLLDICLNNSSIDALVYAGHKTLYGPYGVGGFVKSKKLKVSSLITGGTGNDSSNKEMADDVTKFEAGTRNMLAINGLNSSLKWLLDIGVKQIYEHELMITAKVIKILKKFDYLELYTFANQIGVVSINHQNLSSDEFGRILEKMSIITRVGLQCAPESHKFINTYPSGTVRLSFSYFTTYAELAILENTLQEIEYLI